MKDDEERWPSLLQDKNQYKKTLSIDWDRWVDSDDEDEKNDFDMNGMDFKNFAANAGNFEHDHDHDHEHEEEEFDSDDEEMPDLEEDKDEEKK